MKSHNGIYFQWEGDPEKPVLILSNSLGTNLSMWNKQVEKLARHFHILRYDIRGHGRSDVTPGPYSINRLALDVVELLQECKIKKAWFCGISIGGITGMKLAIDYPQFFHGFILANTSPRIATKEVWQKRIELIKNEGLSPVARGSAARWFTEKFIREHSSIINAMTDYLARMSSDGYSACCEALVDEDLWSQIENIKLPTLIIAADGDQVCTVEEAQKMHQKVANSKLRVLQASHLSNIEKAEEFSESLIDFIQS